MEELTKEIEQLKLKNAELTRRVIDLESGIAQARASAQDFSEKYQRERIECSVLDDIIDKMLDKLARS